MRRLLSSTVILLALTGIAAAETGRFQFERTDSGWLRLDTKTGEISVCDEREGQPVCRVGADERTALLDEIDRLDAEIADLTRRLSALETGRQGTRENLPSEEEFEKTLGFMERFMRRFWGIIQDFERDRQSPEPPQPDRT